MSNPVFPLFLGSGRSGTTVFRNVFDSHSELAMTHEAHFVAQLAQQRSVYETASGFDQELFAADLYRNSNFVRQGIERSSVEQRLRLDDVATFADAVRCVFSLYAGAQDKRLYGDKTPGYVNHIELLAGIFPESKFVHIIRDGRDVALGYLDRDEWGPSTVAEAALYWRSRVSRGRDAGRSIGENRYIEVRYEDMVDDPEFTTRRVCSFLGLDFEPAMLQFHEKGEAFIASSNTPEAFAGLAKPITKGMRDWRTQMANDDVALFEVIAGDLLDSLGYETVSDSPSSALRIRARWAAAAWQARRLEARLQPMIKKLRDRMTAGRT